MEIRNATKLDIDSLLELRLANAIYHAETISKCTLGPNAFKFLKTHTLDCLSNTDCKFLIVTIDKKPVGYIIGFINQQHPIFDFGNEGLIDDFYITPSFQQNGYGEKVYMQLIKWFKEKNIKRINLNVYQNNTKGSSFWSKHNFNTQFNRMSKELNF